MTYANATPVFAVAPGSKIFNPQPVVIVAQGGPFFDAQPVVLVGTDGAPLSPSTFALTNNGDGTYTVSGSSGGGSGSVVNNGNGTFTETA